MLYQVAIALSDAAHTHSGALTLVDLAGSERLAGPTGSQRAETVAINKSLSALADVMTAIAAKDGRVPYRNFFKSG